MICGARVREHLHLASGCYLWRQLSMIRGIGGWYYLWRVFCAIFRHFYVVFGEQPLLSRRAPVYASAYIVVAWQIILAVDCNSKRPLALFLPHRRITSKIVSLVVSLILVLVKHRLLQIKLVYLIYFIRSILWRCIGIKYAWWTDAPSFIST